MKKPSQPRDRRDTRRARKNGGMIGAGIPPLEARELAHLAVSLDPDLCRRDPETGFREAIAFYYMAAFFLAENANRAPIELFTDGPSSGPLMQRLINKWLEAREGLPGRESTNVEKLCFYPDRAKDNSVMTYLDVKTPRGVRQMVTRWIGEKNVGQFWASGRREDLDGKEYYLIPRAALDRLREFEQTRRREAKRRSAVKSRQR